MLFGNLGVLVFLKRRFYYFAVLVLCIGFLGDSGVSGVGFYGVVAGIYILIVLKGLSFSGS